MALGNKKIIKSHFKNDYITIFWKPNDVNLIIDQYFFYTCPQGRKHMQDGASDGEIPKFDGAGYDKDLVEALERDIVSRNPSIHWLESFKFFN